MKRWKLIVTFWSVLFEGPPEAPDLPLEEPDFFADLNLDQVLEAMAAGREEYELKPFFYASLDQAGAVRFRHEVLRDLEKPEVLECVTRFAGVMRRMGEHLAQVEKLRYELQKQSWFVDAVAIYCDAVRSLAEDLTERELTSRGFQGAKRVPLRVRRLGALLLACCRDRGSEGGARRNSLPGAD